jgi:hypothetical protein
MGDAREVKTTSRVEDGQSYPRSLRYVRIVTFSINRASQNETICRFDAVQCLAIIAKEGGTFPIAAPSFKEYRSSARGIVRA